MDEISFFRNVAPEAYLNQVAKASTTRARERGAPHTYTITLGKLYIFFGVMIMMTLYPRTSREAYWETPQDDDVVEYKFCQYRK